MESLQTIDKLEIETNKIFFDKNLKFCQYIFLISFLLALTKNRLG